MNFKKIFTYYFLIIFPLIAIQQRGVRRQPDAVSVFMQMLQIQKQLSIS